MNPAIGRLEDFKPGQLVQAKRSSEPEWALVTKDSDEDKALLFFTKSHGANQQLAYIKPDYVVGTGLGIQITTNFDFFSICSETDLDPEKTESNKLILIDGNIYFLVEKLRASDLDGHKWFFVALDGSVIPYKNKINNHYGMAFVPEWTWSPSADSGIQFNPEI